jgi:hypothetical protein
MKSKLVRRKKLPNRIAVNNEQDNGLQPETFPSFLRHTLTKSGQHFHFIDKTNFFLYLEDGSLRRQVRCSA